MRRSLVISGTAHAVLLVWGVIAFVARPSEAPHADPLPVEFVSATQFSQLTAGVKNAPKPIDNAEPLADKVGEPKPVKELAPKVVDKPEIRTDSAPPPEPKPEAKSQPKVAEKSQPKPEPKADPKPAEKADKPKDKPKPEAKSQPKVAEKSQPKTEPKADPKPAEKADKPKDEPKPEAKSQPKVAEKSQPKPEPKADPKPGEKADKPKDKPKPEAKSQPKVAEKSQPKTEPKADPKPAEKADKPKDKPKPDQVADELKKDEAKKTPKPEKKQREFKPDQIAEELKKDEAKKQRPSPKFDADQVAALLDHREPQRQIATAESLNSVASLGAPVGQAAHLSQSELDALRAKLISLWNPPAAVSAHPDQYVVTIRIRLARNHRLVGQPVVLTSGHGPLFEATRDSAVRAVFQAQPYGMLSLTTYDQWKEIDINFDPREVFGG
jgi:colicin import membrane protein